MTKLILLLLTPFREISLPTALPLFLYNARGKTSKERFQLKPIF